MRWDEVLLHTFPENIAKSVADNQILQVAVFAIIFGVAMGRLSAENRAPLLRVIESLTETMFAFTNIVMYYAPVGVGAAMAYTVGQMGPGVLLHLGRLLLTLYAALLAFGLLGLLPAALHCRRAHPQIFARGRRAGDHCLRHQHFRSGAASRHGGDGSPGCSAQDCRLCDPRGL